MLSPAWEAVMVQLPADTSVSAVPLTVHTELVLEANCTLRPDEAVAESAAGVVPMVLLPGEAKLILCVACATVKLRLTDGAALYVLLPACEALMLQVPADTSVSVLPLTVQTKGVLELNSTPRPDVAVADRAGGVVPSVCVAGAEKLMVCAPITKKDFGWVGAAAKVLLPDCEAVTMQVPGATKVSVVPLTVHTDEVLVVN